PVAGVALSDSGRIAVRWSPATEQYGGQPCCLRAQRRVKRRIVYQFWPKAAAAAQCNHEYKEVTRGREHKVVVKTLPRASLIAGEVQVAFEASLVKLQPGLVAAQAQALNFAGPPVKVADKTAISLGMIGRPVHNEPEFLQLPLNFVGRVEIDLMNCQAGMA